LTQIGHKSAGLLIDKGHSVDDYENRHGDCISPAMHYQQHQIHSSCVVVDTYARLHLGFLDVSGSLGRHFGSLGLSIEAYRTQLRIRPSSVVEARGPGAERAGAFARRILKDLEITGGVDIHLDSAIPDHQGLGSGTQLALAVGRGITQLFDVDLSTREVAARLGRGKRSGIGVSAFDHGGFLLDTGVGEGSSVPPVAVRLPFPEAWRVVLIMDSRGKGLHGSSEVSAFRDLPPFPRETAAHLCHLTLMQILPGIQEGDFDPVADGIAEVQRWVGDHFAPAQGGRFTSKAVAETLAFAEACGHVGIGQSSWGPTGFVLFPHLESAQDFVTMASRRLAAISPLRFQITKACNTASRVSFEPVMRDIREVR
jgi:beta-RFAP synthase